MSLLRKITGVGISYAVSKSEKRNIILTNSISLVTASTTLLLLIGRYLFDHLNISMSVPLLEGSFAFLLPILLNHFGFKNTSRILLCWIPNLFQFYASHIGIKGLPPESSNFVGLRFLLLGFSAIPFLIFDLKNKKLLIVGVLGPLLSILFFDPILNYLGVGYYQVGLKDSGYSFNNVRVFVAFLVIGFSTFLLKRLIEKNEELNENLLAELAEKNKVIRRQAEERLRASEHKFAKIFQQNPDLMVITRESDLMIYDVNDKVSSILGYQREELLGRISSEFTFFVHDSDRKHFFSQYALNGKAETECLWRRKDGTNIYLHIASRQMEMDGEKYFTSVIKDISDRKTAEQEKEAARYSLNERMKELTTLYQTSQILQQEKKPVEEVLQEIVELLPPGWQYPEITAARITVDGKLYATKNFSEGIASQSQWFEMAGNRRGLIEVVYLEKMKPEAEGPFLAEERNLINMIAEMLHVYFEHKYEAEELDKAEANLHATINNTEMFIWSVDRNLRLLSFNQPFAMYMKKAYGVEIQSGAKILGEPTREDLIELEKTWDLRYNSVLAGELTKLEETRAGIDFQYSLSPIREGGEIIGISVFVENITERKTREKELVEANKMVAELKLMALRSVMSPHFIFNVLNAIQYYIAKNDRLNAINYLSTFSKLVRSVLTHSVSNKITLADEIEMLKNYISLEMIRFENKFDFNIEVIDQVDVDNIEIPSLLIQPYVENAILHGLYNKTEKGILSIRIKEEGEAVIFEIEDNGVGRETAMKLRQQNFPSHKSMGVKLTEERLKLINSQNLAAFTIEDLKDAQGPKGTRVTIRIDSR